MSARGLALLVALGAASACSKDPGVDELVRELRADRLARRGAAQASERGAAEDALAGAFAPLRAALTRLVERQDELTDRQAQLASELRAWTQLAVDARQRQQAAQAEELGARLKDLEAQLAAQAKSHGEVEKLMEAALQRASVQLQELLLRLGAEPAPAEEPPPPGGGAGASVEPPPAAPPSAGSTSAGAGARGERDERQASLWPMWGVAALAFGAGAWLLVPRRSAAPAAVAGPEPDAVPAFADAGDAPVQPMRAEMARATSSSPARVAVELSAGSAGAEHKLRDLLSRDARVLARPAPELSRTADGLRVELALLPGLSHGERARLEQRLRDAVR